MDKSANRKFVIPASDSVDLDMAFYLTDKRFEKIHLFLNTQKYTASELKTSYRTINHWGEMGLLPDGAKLDGWRKFSPVELVWLDAAILMRRFGLPITAIVKVKEQIMKWDKKSESYILFEYYVSKALASSDDPYVFVLEDSTADIASIQEIEAAKILFGSQSMLLVSLKAILKERGFNVPVADSLISTTEAEEEFLTAVRLEKGNEIKIKTKGNSISEIETTSTTNETSSDLEKRNKAKEHGLYGQIITTYEDGKPRSEKIVKRKRFDK